MAQVIPDAAVEAAAYALFLDANPDSELQWFDITFHDQDELMRTATRVLEAAAPHVLADGWESGFQKGVEFGDWVGDLDSEKPDFTNPYRPAK